MDRQLQLGLEKDVVVLVSLSGEMRENLVALMADAIVTVLEQQGGDGDDDTDDQ